jgi:ADP-heptose:LPS heptosyltransferase
MEVSPKKILVIRFSSIGDIVLASPVFRCLKQQLPDVEVHFLTKLTMKAVTEANPYIDQFHYFNNNLNELVPKLMSQQFDLIIDLHKNFRSWFIQFQLKVPVYAYHKLSRQKWLLTRFGINQMPDRHITLRSLDTLTPLGVVNDEQGLDYFIPEGKGIQLADIPASHQFGFIAIVIGASYATKKLPIPKLQQLCTQIQYPIILIGGKEDQEEGNEIASIDPIRIYNACGKFSLHESADLVKHSKLVISHDTGLQYIACAFNKKVLAIWAVLLLS